jgi:serine/threonine protein kinase
MSPDQPTEYELLSPEDAAQIDAVCDRFERAWKEAKAGGPAPSPASFVDQSHGAAREALIRELIALEQSCRERYGVTVQREGSNELGAGAEAQGFPSTRLVRGGTEVPAARPTGWPSIPGLELVSVLGSGGMGVVHKARQATLDRDVAVKFLHDARREDSEQRERFLQEARAVARLRHPNLVQLYEFGELPAVGGRTTQPYLVLEYVSGGSLAELLRGSPQPPEEAARLVETLADTIHYAHQQGVIHRDLKPANILLQRTEVKEEGQGEGVRAKFKDDAIARTAVAVGDEQDDVAPGLRSTPSPRLTPDLCVKVTDFGLAKFLTGGDLTHSGYVLGTPSYIAPEQLSKCERLTAAVDIYGLGTLLYEALTGRPPFAAATVEETLCQVRHDEPVAPRRLQPNVPRNLETICLKCLRKEPGRRYATAKDLADDLRRFRAGEPIRARPVGAGERVVAWCRRKPVVAGLVAALVLVFLAGLSGILWQWQLTRRERDTAQKENERAERRLQLVHHRVDELSRLGHELLKRPGQHRTGKDVLEQALAFYKEMLPEDLNDPKIRHEAAGLFGQVAAIHRTLGQADEAAKAYGDMAWLLTGLLEEKPADKNLRTQLADTHRYRGNELRDLGKAREAREAYNQAALLHEGLLRESPDDAFYQMALANTLLNSANLLSRWDRAEALETLYGRILELYRTAVRHAPNHSQYKAELALGLVDQGMFFLDTGRASRAEDAVREALKIHQKLLDGGHLKGHIEPYAARNFVSLGRVLAATGRAQEAEKPYREAANLLDRSVKEFPESVYHWEELARTLTGLADLLMDPARRQEGEEIHLRVIHIYETLRANSPENPRVNNELAWFLATSPEPGVRDASQAVRLAKKAVDARPKSGDYRNTLGVALFRHGEDISAVAELETSMSLREGGDSFDWFFLAMAHWRLGERDKAQTWFDRAVQWMDKHGPNDDQLRRFRVEAEAMLAEARKP